MVKKPTHKIKFWAGLLFAQFLLFYLFSKSPNVVVFFTKIFYLKQKIHQQLFSKIPFSVGDIFYVFCFCYLGVLIYHLFRKKKRPQALQHLFIWMNLFYLFYQITWGMLYFQKPLIEKLPPQQATLEDLKKITLDYIDLTNISREKTAEDKNGGFKIEHLDSLEKEIISAEKALPKAFYPDLFSANQFKPSLFGSLMNYTRILGYYNPFSAEAQYNDRMPSNFIPFTLSHERAHQIGFAREQEANFIGYVICEKSKNSEMQYSAYLYTSRLLLNTLSQSDPEFASKAKALFSKKVKKDLENNRKFAEAQTGVLQVLFYYLNDWFLKSNQQEGAITYNYYLELLLKYKALPSGK